MLTERREGRGRTRRGGITARLTGGAEEIVPIRLLLPQTLNTTDGQRRRERAAACGSADRNRLALQSVVVTLPSTSGRTVKVTLPKLLKGGINQRETHTINPVGY